MKQKIIQLALLGVACLTAVSVVAEDKREGGKSPEAKSGKRDSPEAKAPGPRDGEGNKKTGPRDGEGGAKPEGARDAAGKKPEEAVKQDQAAKLRTKEGKMFLAYDRDKNGGVTGDEIASMFERKQSRRELRKLKGLVEDLDKDGNKKELNLDEFIDYLKHRQSGKRE